MDQLNQSLLWIRRGKRVLSWWFGNLQTYPHSVDSVTTPFQLAHVEAYARQLISRAETDEIKFNT